MTRFSIAIVVLLSTTLGAGCRGASEAKKTDPPSLNVTGWTQKTELYMEYPPLVTGRSAVFAAHLTDLAGFRPLTAGRPRLEFTPETSGASTTLPGSEPSRPGAFRIEGVLPPSGRYTWALVIDAPGLSDRHDLGVVTVFPDDQTALADAEKRPAEDSATFAYLKEQQWTNQFATSRVEEADLRTAIRVPADIEPLTGGEAVVSAPAAGRFVADALTAVGATVRPGQTLGRLEPRLSNGDDRASLSAAVAEARAGYDGAVAEQTRSKRLLADSAVPARRVEDARRAVAVAEARLTGAEARLAQREETLRSGGGAAAGNAFVLRSPIAERVAEVEATLGASYPEGAALFKIVQTDRVMIRVQVPAADTSIVRGIDTIGFEVAGRPEAILLKPHQMHHGGVVDPQTGALSVHADVDNPGGELLVGQRGTAVLYKSDRLRVIAVPKAAVLMEAGRPYVFVQVGGERFARRPIEIATRDGDRIGIQGGISLGDRVVTQGAYEVQLASAAKGLPAESHVH